MIFRFEINLMGRVPGKGVETAFHFKPRWDHKTVVRNSRQDGRWGKEEVTGGTGNLSQNSSFEICFLVLKDRFSVSLLLKWKTKTLNVELGGMGEGGYVYCTFCRLL